MTIADARQFPWIATAFDAVLNPYLERFTRYLSHLASLGVLDCPAVPGSSQWGDLVAQNFQPRQPVALS